MQLITELKSGDAAPAVEVLDAQGQPILLRDVWQKQPTIFCFLRYFG
jgi:peroxiredoxin